MLCSTFFNDDVMGSDVKLSVAVRLRLRPIFGGHFLGFWGLLPNVSSDLTSRFPSPSPRTSGVVDACLGEGLLCSKMLLETFLCTSLTIDEGELQITKLRFWCGGRKWRRGEWICPKWVCSMIFSNLMVDKCWEYHIHTHFTLII